MRLYFTPFYITAQNKQIFINYQIFFRNIFEKSCQPFFLHIPSIVKRTKNKPACTMQEMVTKKLSLYD